MSILEPVPPTLAAADRAAVMGLRQLRHPVQGLRPARQPRDPYEKIADAAQVQPLTGSLPRWRCTSRGTGSTTSRHSPPTPTNGVGIGTINANMFQDDDYKLGA